MAHDHKDLVNSEAVGAIEPLLQDLIRLIEDDAPHLVGLLDVFAQEARFAHQWLAPNLARLGWGDPILEIGAGLMLVSCQLVKEGYQVTALEPLGSGFSGFIELQRIVLNYAVSRGISPTVLAIPIESLDRDEEFSFAFSVNVMEHIDNVPIALSNIGRSLRSRGTYRFTCPNYLFPYEPHFDMPTLFSKNLTEKVFRKRIFLSERISDQAEVWRSLNWISVPVITRACRLLPDISVTFDRSMLCRSFTRILNDAKFANRRSPWVRYLAAWMVGWRLHKALVYLPASVQPVIDCTLTRSAGSS